MVSISIRQAVKTIHLQQQKQGLWRLDSPTEAALVAGLCNRHWSPRLGEEIITHGTDKMRQEAAEEPLPLLQLPDPCLLAVLQCCADDPQSLFNAARTHSRLHQAAVLALRSISIVLQQQQHADSVMQYLVQHGHHLSSINFSLVAPLLGRQPTLLGGRPYSTAPPPPSITLRELPHDMQGLHSMTFEGMILQLQPDSGFQGVLRPGAPVTRLQLDRCRLFDGEGGLAAALSLLPGLQHLSCSFVYSMSGRGGDSFDFNFPLDALQALQQLTYLELQYGSLQGQQGLQHLQGLTGLQDLRICPASGNECTLTVSMLAGTPQLTRMELGRSPQRVGLSVEPGCLRGKSRLQHLVLAGCDIVDSSAGVQELLAHLQQLQQLTHLSLESSMYATTPAAAYSTLTASSKLQHLSVCSCWLPADVWQHIFPAGKQLPHLQYLDISGRFRQLQPDGPLEAPDGSQLVSCCPGLQSLYVWELQYLPELLAPLTELSSLRELSMCPAEESAEGLEVVCRLTGLRQLVVAIQGDAKGLLAQLTQLQQLTQLEFIATDSRQQLQCQAPGDEPVWRQLLRHLQRRPSS